MRAETPRGGGAAHVEVVCTAGGLGEAPGYDVTHETTEGEEPRAHRLELSQPPARLPARNLLGSRPAVLIRGAQRAGRTRLLPVGLHRLVMLGSQRG